MGRYNHPFAFPIADCRWKWQCSASWERRRHCYQYESQAAISVFHSIRGKPKENFRRASSGWQHGMYSYQQEQAQHQRAVALLDLAWQRSDLRNFHSLPHSSAHLLCDLQFCVCPYDKFSPLEKSSTSSYILEPENKQWKILWVVFKETKLIFKLKASQYLKYLIVACPTGWSRENCFHNPWELLYHWRQREHGWGWIHMVYGEIRWCHHLLWVCRFQLKCQEMSKK